MASSLDISEIKIENLCRTCLTKEVELHSVFDVFLGTTTIGDAITTITGLKIEEGDGLPSTVCQECKDKAISAFDFKKRSEEADVNLRDLIRTTNNVSSNTDGVLYQSKSKDFKTENDTGYDHDYLDGDITALENYADLDAVKNENSNHEYVPYKKQCYLVLEPSEKLQEEVDKKDIKVEYDNEESTFCPLCGICYVDSDNLTKHMWAEHAEFMGPKKRGRPKKLLTSTILNKLTENGFYIKSQPMKMYDCLFCKVRTKTKEDLGFHMMEHKDMKVLCCILCKKMYLQRSNFDNHICIEDRNDVNKLQEETSYMSVVPSSDVPIDNSKNMNFLTEVLLQELLDPNGDMENINFLKVCNVCSGVFLSEDEIINHNDAEHPELSARCNLCSKVFASIKSAARHREMCKQIERKHTCNTCGRKFAYEISLNKHILRWHEGQSVSVKFIDPLAKREEKRYQCDTCSKCFYRKDLLARHAKIHMPSEMLFECDICKKKFHRSQNLRIHNRMHERQRDKGSSNCLCLYCGRSFSNSSNLIVHMRRHTGEKPYKCDFCGKGFPRSSDLQCHRRSHTGEKPCKCGVCGKAFSRSNKLSRHMRVHTGLKPYKCTYCDKAFSQSNDLTLHIRRHTGDKPYICEICGDRFIQGTALHNHRRAHGHFPPSSSSSSNQIQNQIQGLTYTVQL